MKIRYKQMEIILLLTITAILANIVVDFRIFNYVGNPIYNQLLFFTIGYVCLSKLFGYKKKYNCAMVIGQLILLCTCATLYYSKSFLDFITFAICTYVNINTILLEQYERDMEEQYE